MTEQSSSYFHAADDQATSETDITLIAKRLLPHWRSLVVAAIGAGALGLAVSFAIPPTYTARTSFLSPQPQQSPAAAALASLGPLTGLAGTAIGVRSQSDQYIALLQSSTIADRIIDQFKLLEIYDKDYRADARKELAEQVRISIGKKDNLLTIEVDDHDPKRAAEMANAFVKELKQFADTLALTEAQQRRVFFETQLRQAREGLANAQLALQQSGFNAGSLKADPKASAESYARLKAEVATMEVRVQALRGVMTEGSPELRQQTAALTSLRNQLAKLEQPLDSGVSANYVTAYRELKYQETLFEFFSRQFELAKLDESRESNLLQIVDKAAPPERKSKPKRSYITLGSAIVGLLLTATWLYNRRPRKPN